MVKKPDSIKRSSFKSTKWDEITSGRNFDTSDVPQLVLLCQWYEVIERCMEDLVFDDGIHVAYANDFGDIKAFPQLSTMKQASAEIRALNKQLGIKDEASAPPEEPKRNPLNVIKFNRQTRAENLRSNTG